MKGPFRLCWSRKSSTIKTSPSVEPCVGSWPIWPRVLPMSQTPCLIKVMCWSDWGGVWWWGKDLTICRALWRVLANLAESLTDIINSLLDKGNVLKWLGWGMVVGIKTSPSVEPCVGSWPIWPRVLPMSQTPCLIKVMCWSDWGGVWWWG